MARQGRPPTEENGKEPAHDEDREDERKCPQPANGGKRMDMSDQVMTDDAIHDLLRDFAAPLAQYATTSPERNDLADVMVRLLWAAMIAGPEMEEETWKSFREIAHLSEDGLKAIQNCYYQQMKPVVNPEQLATLRKRYGLKRKQ
jgi:hypothetical protein